MKPGAGRSAGSYKFPDLLWGPHDVNLGKSEAPPLFRTVSRRPGGPFYPGSVPPVPASKCGRFCPICHSLNPESTTQSRLIRF